MSITLYEHADFKGKTLTLESSDSDLRGSQFNDIVSSVKVAKGIWKLYEHINFEGRCFEVGPGEYNIDVIRQKIGNDVISSVKLLPGITLYEHADFKGRALTLDGPCADLRNCGFNDKTSSVKVSQGIWVLYEHINFAGKSFQVGPGSYNIDVIRARIGNDTISSVQQISISLFEHAGFTGRELTLTHSAPDLRSSSFNDIASSVKVAQGTWKLYQHINYEGLSFVVGPGSYDIAVINERIGNDCISSVKLLQNITLYEHAHFTGTELTLGASCPDLRTRSFNDIASSVRVSQGYWKLWEHVDYAGKSFVVGPGSYDIDVIRAKIGNDTISSVQEMSITLFQHEHFQGKELSLNDSIPDLRSVSFNDEASSVQVAQGFWTLYQHINYEGNSFTVGPGSYDIDVIRQKIGNDTISSVRFVPCITLYQHAGFKGREVTRVESDPDLRTSNFNDEASSVKVQKGQWRLYQHINYEGNVFEVGPGSYDIEVIRQKIGNDTISSVKKV